MVMVLGNEAGKFCDKRILSKAALSLVHFDFLFWFSRETAYLHHAHIYIYISQNPKLPKQFFPCAFRGGFSGGFLTANKSTTHPKPSRRILDGHGAGRGAGAGHYRRDLGRRSKGGVAVDPSDILGRIFSGISHICLDPVRIPSFRMCQTCWIPKMVGSLFPLHSQGQKGRLVVVT